MADMTAQPRRVLALLAVSAAALTGCVGHDAHQAATPTPSTNADQDYLRLLRDGHWTVTDEAQIIRIAHAECRMRGQGTTDVALVGKVARQYFIPMGAARSQLLAAEIAYCPQYRPLTAPVPI
jgi:hypothetical protein